MAQASDDFDFEPGSRHVAQMEYTSSPSPDLHPTATVGFHHPRPSDDFTTPPKKTRKVNSDKEKKKRNYDILGAFFNVYFYLDPTSSVLKGAVWALYEKKVESEYRIPRNAMYRNMWQKFGKSISATQSKYRDLVRGLKLYETSAHLETDPSFAQDQALLEEYGITNLFDFSPEELIPKAGDSVPSPSSSVCSSPVPFPPPKAPFEFSLLPGHDTNDRIPRDIFLSKLQMLEEQAKTLTQSILEMRTLVERHFPANNSSSLEDDSSSVDQSTL